MRIPQFQFTIKRAMIATCWMAVCFGAVVANRGLLPAWEFRGPEMLRRSLSVVHLYTVIMSPFIAGGALFSRAMTGAIVGFAVTSILIAVTSLLAIFEVRTIAERHGFTIWMAWGLIGVVTAILILYRRRR